ncbi:MAG: SAM-dependent methyltransferase [Thainema sp.]
MVVKLQQVVPFGRSLDEYRKIFNLTDADLQRRIIGVGDGPASFNAEATALGASVLSVDPIYQFSGADILERFNTVVDDIIEQVTATSNDYVWGYHRSPADLRQSRSQTIQRFIQDYDQGQRERRYQVQTLPSLDIADNAFDLALCSHLLFLYSDHFDTAFHIDSIRDMLRVSSEVRIFPLLTLDLLRSQHLDPVINTFTEAGYSVEQVPVAYEFQKGANEMLRIVRPEFSSR